MTAQPITYDLLRAKHACDDQLTPFRHFFGESAPLTVEAATDHAQDFDWDWAARYLLSDAAQGAYYNAKASAWDDYGKATASDQDAYAKAIAPDQDAYAKAIAPDQDAYSGETASAWDTYRRAIVPAWHAYRKACAEAFARAYLSQENDQ